MNIGVIILIVAVSLIPIGYVFDRWNDKAFRTMERRIKDLEAARIALGQYPDTDQKK